MRIHAWGAKATRRHALIDFANTNPTQTSCAESKGFPDCLVISTVLFPISFATSMPSPARACIFLVLYKGPGYRCRSSGLQRRLRRPETARPRHGDSIGSRSAQWPSASAISPSVPTMTRHQANSAKAMALHVAEKRLHHDPGGKRTTPRSRTAMIIAWSKLSWPRLL